MDYLEQEEIEIARETAQIIQNFCRDGSRLVNLQKRTINLARLRAGNHDWRSVCLATQLAINTRLAREFLEEKGLRKVVILDSGDVCAVCQEEMEVGDEGRAMGCLHTFHWFCISEWVRQKPNCPLCRWSDMDNYSVKRRRLDY